MCIRDSVYGIQVTNPAYALFISTRAYARARGFNVIINFIIVTIVITIIFLYNIARDLLQRYVYCCSMNEVQARVAVVLYVVKHYLCGIKTKRE